MPGCWSRRIWRSSRAGRTAIPLGHDAAARAPGHRGARPPPPLRAWPGGRGRREPDHAHPGPRRSSEITSRLPGHQTSLSAGTPAPDPGRIRLSWTASEGTGRGVTGHLRLRVTAVRPPVVARIDREVEITRLPTAPPQGERRATWGREADLVARCCREPSPESLEGLRQRALQPVGGHTVRDPFRRVVGLVHSRCPMSRSMSPGVGSRYRWPAASDVPDRVRHGGLDEVVAGSSGPSALQMFPAPAWGEEVSVRMIFLPPPWSVEVMRRHLRCTVRWSREVFPRSALLMPDFATLMAQPGGTRGHWSRRVTMPWIR